MKTPPFGWLLACALSAPAWAADVSPSPIERVTLDLRARHEHAEQTGLRDANALTLRTRLGLTTTPWRGLQATIEAENIVAADGDAYNQSGLNPGGAGRVVIADPEVTELNQAFLRYQAGDTAVVVGRQRLVLDQARFIGDVGWRQNAQTFDAVTLVDRSLDQTTLTLAYLDRVNRILGRDHAQGVWDSESYVAHAAYAGLPAKTVLTGYAYLLDFDQAAAQGTATYGASVTGAPKLRNGAVLSYRAEFAWQTDHGSSALDYGAGYGAAEFAVQRDGRSLGMVAEVLGADGGAAFRTPLATLHAFNGWADLFTTTPVAGLRDISLRGTATLPAQIKFAARHHWFASENGDVRYGRELDLQASRLLAPGLTALVKYARFKPDAAGWPDVTKWWIQVEYVR